MKGNVVIYFSSSYEDDYYSSSSIEYNPSMQKRSNPQQQKSELIEIHSDSDDTIIPSIPKTENKVAFDQSKRSICSVKPIPQLRSNINKVPIVLNEYYSEDEDYCNENETENNSSNTNSTVQTNSNTVSSLSLNQSNSNSINSLATSSDSNTQSVFVQLYGIRYNISDCNTAGTEVNYSHDNSNDRNLFPIYRCRRKVSKIVGRPIKFEFYRSDTQIMSAIGNGVKHDNVAIFLNDSIVSRIRCKKSRTQKKIKYDLLKEPEGEIEATIYFTHSNNNLPREVSITINDPLIGLPNKIESQKPKYNKLKKLWQMNFKGKFVLRSIKNTILVDDQLNKIMFVRKTNKNDLDIDVLTEVDEIFTFYFAISSFLCKL